MKKEILLKLKNINAGYGHLRILHDVSLQIDEGEVVAIMGPNGAGKSTVLKTVFGMTEVEGGSVQWRERKINPVPHEVVRMGVSYVPQGRRVFKYLSVEENLEIGGYTVKDKKEVKRRIDEVMEIFPDLRKKRKEKSINLSGGQQQMLAIARGLMTDPHILLLDEPTLGLSPKLVKAVFTKIKEINERRHMAVVIVEHNLKSLLGIVDHAYVLDKGKIVIEDTAESLASSDALERVFLGTYNKG